MKASAKLGLSPRNCSERRVPSLGRCFAAPSGKWQARGDDRFRQLCERPLPQNCGCVMDYLPFFFYGSLALSLIVSVVAVWELLRWR
jgi:hypothetical protein